MSDITFVRSEVTAAEVRWAPVRDAVAGQAAVKARGARHLPIPNPLDLSPENAARYANYLARAVFVNFTGRTRAGLIGTAFGDWPEVKMPTSIDVLKTDADGTGVGLVGLAQQSLGDLLDCGRSGLLVDFPARAQAVSRADQARGDIRPNVIRYQPEQIINWATEKRGGVTVLSLIVLYERIEQRNNYAITQLEQWRELSLDAGQYVVRLWQKDAKGDLVVIDTFMPTQGSGQPWDRIPFTFIGATNNDATIDDAPLYDLAELNLAHYRNSADFEEAAFLVGQPQIWLSGASAAWSKAMADEGVYVGSRAILPVPSGEQAGLLQPEENTMSRTGMQDKVADMAGIGARILVKGEAVKTAEQSRSETQAAQSVLSLCCDNVSEAFTKALSWAANFQNVSGECSFAIDTEFGGLSTDPQQLAEVVKTWQAGAMPTSDKNSYLRRAGLVDQGKTDEQIAEEIAQDGQGLNLDEPEPIVEVVE